MTQRDRIERIEDDDGEKEGSDVCQIQIIYRKNSYAINSDKQHLMQVLVR